DTTFSTMIDKGLKSYRARRPGAPLRSHEHGNGADPAEAAHAHAIGRPRGGLTTRIHLACDGRGRPLGFVVTGGNINDCAQLEQVLAQIRVCRPGPGRPRTRPDHFLGDKGYSSRDIRDYLRKRGIAHTIPERSDQQANRRRRGSGGGRPPAFDKERYKRRNVVERCFNA
ncbi:IS5 family transposase, partial [Streptomyces sp. or20]|uniref:IS5 family transposase n=1 Tax=Streptomyces sp. or20 TaxID=1828016 RepID=UPI000D1B41E8